MTRKMVCVGLWSLILGLEAYSVLRGSGRIVWYVLINWIMFLLPCTSWSICRLHMGPCRTHRNLSSCTLFCICIALSIAHSLKKSKQTIVCYLDRHMAPRQQMTSIHLLVKTGGDKFTPPWMCTSREISPAGSGKEVKTTPFCTLTRGAPAGVAM